MSAHREPEAARLRREFEGAIFPLAGRLREARAEHASLSRQLARDLERSRVLSSRLAENWERIRSLSLYGYAISGSPRRCDPGPVEAATRVVMQARASSFRAKASVKTLEDMSLKAWDWAARFNGGW